MKILYAAGEALPFAATGGLGDVMGSLPAAVKATLGDKADVRVVIPLYPSVRNGWNDKLERVFEGEMTLSWRRQYLGIYKIERSGVTFYFIDNEYYFKRAQAYGNFDDGERFAFFSKAVLELMRITDFYPDILHANDWQSALSVIYLKRKYAHLERYQRISALYTIHNIDYQGVFGFDILGDVFELDEWDRSIVDYSGNINLTKGAIVCADRVTTVSPRYSKEIMTEYYSAGLYHILRMYREKIIGIINGIDISYYDPKTDPDIASNYSADDMTGKAKNKAALEDICSFPGLFGAALSTGKEIIERQIRENDKIWMLSIYNIQPHRLVFGLLQDMREPYGKKQWMLNKTDEVIRKHMETVRQIACLLGENAAFTDTSLKAVIETLKGKEE